jgi:hypothetical protein
MKIVKWLGVRLWVEAIAGEFALMRHRRRRKFLLNRLVQRWRAKREMHPTSLQFLCPLCHDSFAVDVTQNRRERGCPHCGGRVRVLLDLPGDSPSTDIPHSHPDLAAEAATLPPIGDRQKLPIQNNGSGIVESVSKYPISTECPRCCGTEFEKCPSEEWVAFVSDRICNHCGARYTPPTPAWAAVLFILVGSIMVACSVFAVGGSNGLGDILSVGLIGFIGIMAIRHGIRALTLRARTSSCRWFRE